MHDDRQLVEATLRGEMEAFAQLVRAYQSSLVTSACHILRCADDAEDLAQETLLTAYQRLRELRDPGKFRPWLFSILRRKCLNQLHSLHAQELSLDTCLEIPATPASFADDELWELLNLLPLADREVLAARYLAGLEYEEVAAALGCSVNTAYVRCKRARDRLRTLLRQADEEDTRATMQRAMSAVTTGLLGDAFVQRILQEVKPMHIAVAKPPISHLPTTPAWLPSAGWKIAAAVMVVCALAGFRLAHRLPALQLAVLPATPLARQLPADFPPRGAVQE